MKFRQASNYCKSILEVSKLAYANKIRVSPLETWLWQLGKLLIVFSAKINLQYFLCLVLLQSRFCLLHLRNACWNLFANSNLEGICSPSFFCRINMRLHNIPVTLDLVKEVIILRKWFDLVVFQWWLWRTVRQTFICISSL